MTFTHRKLTGAQHSSPTIKRIMNMRKVAITLIALPAFYSFMYASASGDDLDQVVNATLNKTATSLTIVYTTGKPLVERRETPGDTFEAPQLSPDRGTVGWSVDQIVDANYPVPVWLEFVHHGIVTSIACKEGVPRGWRFEGNEAVVMDCGFPHGQDTGRRKLVAIGTAKIVASVDLREDGSVDPNAPAWARTALQPGGLDAIASGVGSSDVKSASTSPVGSSPGRPLVDRNAWEKSLKTSPAGCFVAHYPDPTWKKVACVKAPNKPYAGSPK